MLLPNVREIYKESLLPLVFHAADGIPAVFELGTATDSEGF